MARSERLRVFFDADVLIAGSASRTGASHLLLRLAEVGLIDSVTCAQAVREVERNLAAKLPAAVPAFRAILTAVDMKVVSDSPASRAELHLAQVHPDDRPILMSALASKCDYLATFNVRHYRGLRGEIIVARPGDILAQIRRRLVDLT